MLNLRADTDSDWVARAVEHIDDVLLDHAHCEKKAASTAINLIFRYPDHTAFLRPLSELAREELEHFELVLDHIEARGRRYERLRPSPYAGRLLSIVRPEEPARLLDTLLCCALIEARSCERMKLLSEAAVDASLRDLYRGLLASEARHHRLYFDLACAVFPTDAVRARLHDIAEHEATVIAVPAGFTRMHC